MAPGWRPRAAAWIAASCALGTAAAQAEPGPPLTVPLEPPLTEVPTPPLAVPPEPPLAEAPAPRRPAPLAVAPPRRLDLRLRPALPRHLAMRPRRLAAAPSAAPLPLAAAPAARSRQPIAPTAPPTSPAPGALGAAAPLAVTPQASAVVRTGQEELAFRFDLGFALDGAALSGEPSRSGHAITAADLTQVRSYGFGDVFVGSRGFFLPNLSGFFSAHYRLGNSLSQPPPIAEPDRRANELQVRSGWAEIKDPAKRRWLSPLRVRAGRYYVYGPWVSHVDGLTVAWDGPIVTAAATFGANVTTLTAGERSGLPEPVSQLSARADFTAHKSKVPLVASAELLTTNGHTHLHTQLAWQPRATLAIGASARTLDGQLVNERLSVRARIREINSLFAEVAHQTERDWRWDPQLVDYVQPISGAPRSYLELGPVLPRLTFQVRAGTVLFDNVDLFLRAAGAADLRDELTMPASSFSAAYGELGGALEVRLRRTLAVGAQLTSRTTRRLEAEPRRDSNDEGEALPLPENGSYGDRSFVEGGGTARLTLGARTLTFSGEAYARRTRFAVLYTDPRSQERIDATTHLGGRAAVDAWINRKLRVMARYEVVTQVKRAPEITGFKALRVIVEATF